MPAYRFARTLVSPSISAEHADARASHHSARCDPPCLEVEPPSPASADSMACPGLDRPSAGCLAVRREARSRYVPTDFCFPLLRLRVPAPHRLPASLRSFHFALGRWACTHNQETGGPGVFTTPDPLRRVARVGARFLTPRIPERTVPLTPLSPPQFLPPALLYEWSSLRPPRPHSKPLREDEVSRLDPRCLPSPGDTRAPARAEIDLELRSRDGFPLRSDPRRPFEPQSPRCAFDARLLATA